MLVLCPPLKNQSRRKPRPAYYTYTVCIIHTNLSDLHWLVSEKETETNVRFINMKMELYKITLSSNLTGH